MRFPSSLSLVFSFRLLRSLESEFFRFRRASRDRLLSERDWEPELELLLLRFFFSARSFSALRDPDPERSRRFRLFWQSLALINPPVPPLVAVEALVVGLRTPPLLDRPPLARALDHDSLPEQTLALHLLDGVARVSIVFELLPVSLSDVFRV